MSTGKNARAVYALFLAVLLMAVSASIGLTACVLRDRYFAAFSQICTLAAEKGPEAEGALMQAVKDFTAGKAAGSAPGLLPAYGYRPSDLLSTAAGTLFPIAAACLVCGLVLFAGALVLVRKREDGRDRALASWLEKANSGAPEGLAGAENREGEFSKLQDELYKTVTALYKTREQAVQAKSAFAENLSGIAHQLKTPITALSFSAQSLAGRGEPEGEKIGLQLKRLLHLEEALLLLARLDAGVLELEKRETDVFALLSMAADVLWQEAEQNGVSFDLPEEGPAAVFVDPEWTLEALINLMKNCLEHTPDGGSVHCRYARNPLYTEILLWDEGPGFSPGELPKLFQRFYRGRNARPGGIGLGLALAKELLERQNGTVRAYDRPEGGACFEIRLYSH